MRSSLNCSAGRAMCWQTAADPYLSRGADLQFGHSQRVGYDVATNVLSQLQRIGNLHKRRPEHASLECCARRISRRSSWKRALSVTTAKSGCWGAMITRADCGGDL